MPARKDDLRDHLSRYREINITVTGRKSGRAISIPVWFLLGEDKLYLLPVSGSDTQWYKNAPKSPTIRIHAGGSAADVKAVRVTHARQVASAAENFSKKYGPGDVKKYYTKFDVAAVVHMN